ncbi:MAG: HAMP domain-containing sensor histidine kinase, partial [Betaproteobacteria bacterium]
LMGITILWLAGVLGSGLVLKRLIDEKSDDELQESAAMLLSLVRLSDDLLVTAAALGDRPLLASGRLEHERLVYLVRDGAGRVLLISHNAPSQLRALPLAEGLADAGDWRVVTVFDPGKGHYVQLADPLSERRDALITSLLWLTGPLALLLAFAAWIVFRASRSLADHVQRTALAVAQQDPQALGMLPLDGVVTEMKPAVEATNRLLARLADALEAERSFTYNSAHELRTPIAAALAQAQLLAANAKDGALHEQAATLVDALSRLSRLAGRLLALARAEGTAPLANEWVDLARVVRLSVDEFRHHAGMRGRRLVADVAPVRVRGDLDAVGLALRNLIENAMVHGAGGTTICVLCKDTPDGAVLAVIDDGPGSPSGELGALVKRFARGTRAAGSGAGLGLSIVDTLARRMGAQLVLRCSPSAPGTGFEARVIWPASSTRGARAGKVA